MKRILVASVLVLLVAGCGDDASTTTAASAATTTTAPTTTAATTTTTTVPATTASTEPTTTTTEAPEAFSRNSIAPGQQRAYSFVSGSGVEIEYLLYLPEEYDDDRAWPLILSLHGFLGTGDQTLESVRTQNPVAWVDPNVEFPFVVVAPKAKGLWSEVHEPMDELFEVLGDSLSIDGEAQFLTGLSAGAPGVWLWALARPDRFAGIAPVAGSLTSVPEDICLLSDLPIWMAHGEADSEIQIDWFVALIEALEECGSTVVRFADYPSLGHFESISTAYAGPDLYEWMLEQVP